MIVIGVIFLLCVVCFLGGRYIRVDHYEREVAQLKKDVEYYRDANTRTPPNSPRWPPGPPPLAKGDV